MSIVIRRSVTTSQIREDYTLTLQEMNTRTQFVYHGDRQIIVIELDHLVHYDFESLMKFIRYFTNRQELDGHYVIETSELETGYVDDRCLDVLSRKLYIITSANDAPWRPHSNPRADFIKDVMRNSKYYQ